MDNFEIYNDISARTNGDIYVGVVGPVRTGKSTFIKRFMEKVVLDRVDGDAEKKRMIDEMPQAANGKQIMTTGPKFVPNKAVEVKFSDTLAAKIRLVDCVGYFVPGAEGAENADGTERLVKSPWSEQEITLRQAAEIGTHKVICDHSTIAVLVSTDGSIGEINRLNYLSAEEKVVEELKKHNKPFVVVLNSTKPDADSTQKMAKALAEKYQTSVVPANVEKMEEADFDELLEKVLYEFPVRQIEFNLPKWARALPADSSLIQEISTTIKENCNKITKMKDANSVLTMFDDPKYVAFRVSSINLSNGTITYSLDLAPTEFYNLLSSECGVEIPDDFYLMSYMKHLVYAKKEYDKIKKALEQVKETGYGIVSPSMEELVFEEPKIISKGGSSGVQLRASAPSLHIMRVDVQTEVTPALGNMEQSQAFANYMLGEFESNPQGIWNTNMFGKPLSSLMKEGIDAKVNNVPEEAQTKMRKTLTKIVNERKGGIICILL